MLHSIPTTLTEMLGIRYPIIVAPMFLVSNTAMVQEAIAAGATGAIPALNYRDDAAFRSALEELTKGGHRPFGINLIVNKSNVRLAEQLKACVEYKVDFIITSLGSPEATIRACKPLGIKVFCDVTDASYARKVEALGADALVAVNNQAGGHAGALPPERLIPELLLQSNLPIISAGGVGTGKGIADMLSLGAVGVSMGSIFIASKEAPVSDAYKQAVVAYGAADIVMTDRLSGTPCTVINTPYVQQSGTKQSFLERFLNRNKSFKRVAKMLTFYKGMKLLEKAAFSATYKTMWCAGPSIEHVQEIKPLRQIVESLLTGYEEITIVKIPAVQIGNTE
jgi:nitronate monooxygenase